MGSKVRPGKVSVLPAVPVLLVKKINGHSIKMSLLLMPAQHKLKLGLDHNDDYEEDLSVPRMPLTPFVFAF